jgi:ribosome maturation factor RimP
MENVEEKVLGLAGEVARALGVSVEGVELLGQGRRKLLRVTIDKEGGVTLDDCEAFSHDIEALLDVEDPILGSYTLEVSSPGLDRPLRGPGDFGKSVGKLVRVVTRQKVENQNFFIGRISGVSGDGIRLTLKGDRQVEILFDNISRARLEVEL